MDLPLSIAFLFLALAPPALGRWPTRVEDIDVAPVHPGMCRKSSPCLQALGSSGPSKQPPAAQPHLISMPNQDTSMPPIPVVPGEGNPAQAERESPKLWPEP